MWLTQKVKKNIQHNPCFGRSNTIIIGTSGGPDSTALTHILHALQYELGFHLHIAHFNHKMHRNANADQKFVEQLADRLNVPCSVGQWKNRRKTKRGSLEDAARQHRFQFLTQLAGKIKAHAIVLAHTEDDLAETVLMRILRGTGLQGLRGILPVREIDGVTFIRPLINAKKSEILNFLKKKKLPYRLDPTNKQTKFFRNKIRLELLPLLKKQYNSNITGLLTNLADNISTDYSYLEDQTHKLFTKLIKHSKTNNGIRIDLDLYSRQHPALKRMLVRGGIERLKGDTKRLALKHFQEIDDLLENRPKNAIVHLPQKMCARKDSRHLILTYN